MRFAFATIAGTALMTAQPLVDDDVLEPSVENEVAHALNIAPTNSAIGSFDRTEAICALAGTNRLTSTEMAITLISSQHADGRWFVGTNDVTAVAIELLEAIR